MPVIAVDEEELVNWGAEAGADHDSDDSNAESFYGNSYPDEDLYQVRTACGDGWPLRGRGMPRECARQQRLLG